MTYDLQVYELAEHLLADEPDIDSDDAREELARLIQTAVDDWIADKLGRLEDKG